MAAQWWCCRLISTDKRQTNRTGLRSSRVVSGGEMSGKSGGSCLQLPPVASFRLATNRRSHVRVVPPSGIGPYKASGALRVIEHVADVKAFVIEPPLACDKFLSFRSDRQCQFNGPRPDVHVPERIQCLVPDSVT